MPEDINGASFFSSGGQDGGASGSAGSQAGGDAGQSGSGDGGDGGGKPITFAELQKAKGYKDADALAHAYHSADQHIGKLESENKGYKEWQQKAVPFITVAKLALDNKIVRQNPETGELELNPDYKSQTKGKADGEGDNKPDPEDEKLKRVIGDMLGSKLDTLDQRLTAREVRDSLDMMRADKENFPYMSKELEKTMGEELKFANNAFPKTLDGLKVLYNAAVGKNLATILKAEIDGKTKEITESLLKKSDSFMESDQEGFQGLSSDENDEIRKGILEAGVGKSQI